MTILRGDTEKGGGEGGGGIGLNRRGVVT